MKNKLYIQNVDSFSHLLDRLCIENIKLADFVRRIEFEQRNDSQDLELIDRLYRGLKLANESRSHIKNKLDKFLHDVINEGNYRVLEEVRTAVLPEDQDEANLEERIMGQKPELDV